MLTYHIRCLRTIGFSLKTVGMVGFRKVLDNSKIRSPATVTMTDMS